jgi:hypothetical protein
VLFHLATSQLGMNGCCSRIGVFFLAGHFCTRDGCAVCTHTTVPRATSQTYGSSISEMLAQGVRYVCVASSHLSRNGCGDPICFPQAKGFCTRDKNKQGGGEVCVQFFTHAAVLGTAGFCV